MAESITAAVGTPPAPNRFQDVETIQTLLNQVPPADGGPVPLLDVDGICGPLTIGAIRKFQRRQLGFEDGRVDTELPLEARHLVRDHSGCQQFEDPADVGRGDKMQRAAHRPGADDGFVGQRLFDRPFLLLAACLLIFFVFYTGWGLVELALLDQAPLP